MPRPGSLWRMETVWTIVATGAVAIIGSVVGAILAKRQAVDLSKAERSAARKTDAYRSAVRVAYDLCGWMQRSFVMTGLWDFAPDEPTHAQWTEAQTLLGIAGLTEARDKLGEILKVATLFKHKGRAAKDHDFERARPEELELLKSQAVALADELAALASKDLATA